MKGRRPPPAAPRPDLVRRPRGSYGWLEVRMLTQDRLRDLGPEATAVLVFLALVADRRGASWWSRAKMAGSLSMSLGEVDRALQRLEDHGLLAHRPWKTRDRDGVWQLLPLPEPATQSARGTLQTLGAVLHVVRKNATDPPRSPPDSRAS